MNTLIQEKIRDTIILNVGDTTDKVYFELRRQAKQQGISETDFKEEYNKIVQRTLPILDGTEKFKKVIKDKIENSKKKPSKGDIEQYCEKGNVLSLSNQFVKDVFIPFILKNYQEDFFQEVAESESTVEENVVPPNLIRESVTKQPKAKLLQVKEPSKYISPPAITHTKYAEKPELIKEISIDKTESTVSFSYDPKEIWAWTVGGLLIILLGWYIYYKSFPTPKPIVTEIDNTETQKSHPTNIETEFKNSIITKTNIKQLINEIKFNKDNIDDTKSLDASTELAEILKNYKLMDEDKKQLIATKNKIAEQIYSTESLIKIEPSEKKFHQRQILKWQNIESKIEEILKLQK